MIEHHAASVGRLWIDITCKVPVLSLVVPFFHPVNWTQRRERSPENFAWSEILTLHIDTLVVVHIWLPAMLRLVLVRKSGVKSHSVKWATSCLLLFFGHYHLFIVAYTFLLTISTTAGVTGILNYRWCYGFNDSSGTFNLIPCVDELSTVKICLTAFIGQGRSTALWR